MYKPTLCALLSVVTWTGVSKLTAASVSAGAPIGVVMGLGLRLELDTPEEELGAMLGRLGMAPGSKAVGLINRLAWI